MSDDWLAYSCVDMGSVQGYFGKSVNSAVFWCWYSHSVPDNNSAEVITRRCSGEDFIFLAI